MASNPQIILIDGPAGAGKTTLALKLQLELNCQVVHLDDLYNGWEDALGQRLTETLKDLLQSFFEGKPYLLPIFDWKTMEFSSTRLIHPDKSLIIEGVGAGQSAIRDLSTKLYWVDVEAEVGMARVLERDGQNLLEQMKLWKIREAKHFNEERTREYADFIISTT